MKRIITITTHLIPVVLYVYIIVAGSVYWLYRIDALASLLIIIQQINRNFNRTKIMKSIITITTHLIPVVLYVYIIVAGSVYWLYRIDALASLLIIIQQINRNFNRTKIM